MKFLIYCPIDRLIDTFVKKEIYRGLRLMTFESIKYKVNLPTNVCVFATDLIYNDQEYTRAALLNDRINSPDMLRYSKLKKHCEQNDIPVFVTNFSDVINFLMIHER